MERKSAWESLTSEQEGQVEALADDYKAFITANKTERACCLDAIARAREAGYVALDQAISEGRALKPGDKVFATSHDKAVMLVQLGRCPLQEGANILGAHIDSPRLDLKQNPLFEKDGFTLLDTHYYGGIKKYQWVALPLALHGVVAKKDGTVIPVDVGDGPDDPVFCVTDLLPHLGAKQLEKKGSEVVEGEDLDVLAGNKPVSVSMVDPDDPSCDGASEAQEAKTQRAGEKVRQLTLDILKERYGISEEDFLSAELEVVPAGPARDLGFDCSMVIGYGQDDRVCAYTSLVAQLAVSNEVLDRASVCILVDKEEIGSVGATGMESAFFEHTFAEIMALAGEEGELKLRRALKASRMLSSDVSAGVDPAYESAFEMKNAAFLGHGLVFNKYTGARGKSGSNDARAEYLAHIRRVMDEAGVVFQTAELGRVDVGGGGTIAYIPARFGMDVIDSGVPVLSMHSPWEVTSKVDIFEARRGYEAFLRAR